MNTLIIIAIAMALLVALYFLLRPAVSAYRKYRGPMVVTCPETKLPVGVEVDVPLAAVSGIRGYEELRLADCTRWPERHDCDQACLRQIEVAPEECLIRTKLTKWYEGKSCAVCGTPFGEIHWHDHRPALMDSDGMTVEWHDLHPEELPGVLETHLPVCWNCNIMKSFLRDHGDLVTLRAYHPMATYREQ